MYKSKLSIDSFEALPGSVLQEHVIKLFKYGVVYFWTHVLSATLLLAVLWVNHPLNPVLMVVWYAAVIGLAATRWVISGRFNPASIHSREHLLLLAQRYLLFSTILNSLWGVSGAVLFVAEPATLALHIACLMLVALSSVPLLLITRAGFYIQIVTVLLPIIPLLLWQADFPLRLLAFVLLALGAMAMMVGHILCSVLDGFQSAQLRLMEQVHTDPVTQLVNRRYFEQVFKLEWRRAARSVEPLSLLMVEVDHLKRFTMQHGQHATEQCLQMVASSVQDSVRRASDVVARYGDNAFVLLLPDTGIDEAVFLGKQLQTLVKKKRLEEYADGAQPCVLSVSIGVSCCQPVTGTDAVGAGAGDAVFYPAMLLKSADRALYRARRDGGSSIAQEYCGNGQGDTPLERPVGVVPVV